MATSEEPLCVTIGDVREQEASLIEKPYVYETLESHRHIRLLAVEPGSEFEKGFYDITTTTLDQAPPYDAISYTWGLPAKNHRLKLADGTFLPLTDTLLLCLPLLAKICGGTGYLWIDQICVNQMNTTERNHQVALMPEIYRRAARLTMYLQVLNFINVEHLNKLSDVIVEYLASTKPIDPFLDTIGVKRYSFDQDPNTMPPLLQVAMRIFQHPWFRRAWVFQEVVLSKIQRFLFGSRVVPLSTLLLLAVEIIHLWDRATPEHHAPEFEQAMAGAYQLYCMALMILERANLQPHTDFWDFLSMISPNSHCSGPGGLVLAFQGLLDDTRFSELSHNDSTTKEIFIETTANYL